MGHPDRSCKLIFSSLQVRTVLGTQTAYRNWDVYPRQKYIVDIYFCCNRARRVGSGDGVIVKLMWKDASGPLAEMEAAFLRHLEEWSRAPKLVAIGEIGSKDGTKICLVTE